MLIVYLIGRLGQGYPLKARVAGQKGRGVDCTLAARYRVPVSWQAPVLVRRT